MLKNNGKTAVSRYFLMALFVICLVCTAVGFNAENSYAVDIDDDNCTDSGVQLDVQEKLENSQYENDVLELNLNDEVLGSSHTLNGGSFQDIQNAIKSASSGDVIKLSGTFSASSGLEKITVNKKLTITSNSQAILDGKQSSEIFFLNADAKGTVISNLKFINGIAKEGGAIRIYADDVTVYGCTFENNYATNGGGAVASRYDPYSALNAIVSNCKFTKNSAKIAGGALILYGDNSRVLNCDFDSNYVTNTEGLAVYGGAIQLSFDTEPSFAYAINCTFTNNWARSNSVEHSHGGAGCVRDGVTYSGCTFIGNSAGEGGALTFHASGKLQDCVFINNHATEFGGAISTGMLYKSMTFDLQNCKFEENSAPLGGAAQLSGENIKVENTNFTNNYANTNGGAVNIAATSVEMTDNIFKSNKVGVDGGAVYINGKNVLIQDSIFDSNDAIPDYDKINDGLGGAIYVNSTSAVILNNEFKYNTARNGSAVYYDQSGTNLRMANNVMAENQAWVYALPISSKDIYYGERENLSVVIHGGNNIARFGNLAVSNAIFNAADNLYINVDGFNPIDGATDTGELYQDDREYGIDILLTVYHQDGSVVYNNTLKSSYLGQIDVQLNDLKPGYYYVSARHFEDTYYKQITNTTSFRVYPKVDNQITLTSDKDVYDYEDVVMWTINITNNGPNNATGVFIDEILPEGLVYVMDTSNGLFNAERGVLNVSTLDVGEKISFNIVTIVEKTGEIVNGVNITANELDTNLNNNHAQKSIKVNPASDIQVTKTVNNTNPHYRDLVEWTIVVKNNGPDVAHNVVVTDIIPQTITPIQISGNYSSKKGTWEIKSLGVNEQAVFTIISRVDTTGTIENKANATADEFDYDLSNNQDSQTIKIDPTSDLVIVKFVNASSLNYMDVFKWTLTIINNGPNDATGVKITDFMPDGLTYINSTMEYDDGEIKIGNLTVGQIITVDIVCSADFSGNYTNIAEVHGNEYDPELDNNMDNESVTVNPAADLEITKEINASDAKYGETVTWTVTVKNNGPDIAHEIRVSEKLPEGLIWIEDDCDGDYNPQTGIWCIDELDVDEETELNIICKINKTGIFVNIVNATGREFDYNLTNNQANESLSADPAADLTIEKTVDNSNPSYKEEVIWEIVVTNNGPDKANQVSVTDVLPEGLIFVNATPSKGFFDLENDLWWVCCLEKDEVETLEIICIVDKTGTITNYANISAKEFDPDTSNNIDEETIDVPASVDIQVIQDVDVKSPYFGDAVTWMIKITNNGPDDATDVVLTDILPDSLVYVDYKSTKGEYLNGQAVNQSVLADYGILRAADDVKDVWKVGILKVGEVQYLNITTTVHELGQIVNDAEATAAEYDWDETNNQDDAEVDVLPVADISIEKSVNKANPNYGSVVTWTLKVTNNGPNDASDVKVTDSLAKGLKFIKSSDDKKFNGQVWDVGDLKAGESKTLTIQCRVMQTGSIKNTASVTCREFDPDLSNNRAEKIISVPPAADLAVTKIASRYNYKFGEVIIYDIEVVNNGPDTARNIKVTDVLDKLLKIKSFKVSKGSFNKISHVWTISSLGYGHSAKMIIKVVSTGSGVIKNTVKVTSDTFDRDLSNNRDYAKVKVAKKSSNDPSGKASGNYGNNGPSNGGDNEPNSLEMHPTGNPIVILVISLLFSAVLLESNKSNKR